MAGVEGSPLEGKFQTINYFTTNPDGIHTATTLSGASADIAAFQVPYLFAEVLTVAIHLTQNTGAVTTGAIVNLDYTPPGGTRAALVAGFSGPQVTANTTAPMRILKSYDQAVVDTKNNLRGPAQYPQVAAGGVLTAKFTQGVGGTQTGFIVIEWRARPRGV